MIVNVGAICIREVVIASHDDSLLEVAKLMREHHVGDVIIVEPRQGVNHPIGIVTDRDIVLAGANEAFARLDKLFAGDLVVRTLVSVREGDTIDDALEVMQTRGVRRAPVVDDAGALVGILTVDDLLDLFAERFARISALFDRGRRNERAQRP